MLETMLMVRLFILDGKIDLHYPEKHIFTHSFDIISSAFHEGDQLPAKIIPSKQACYVSHNGLEIFKPNFELLSGHGFTWVGSSNGIY